MLNKFYESMASKQEPFNTQTGSWDDYVRHHEYEKEALGEKNVLR